MKASLLILFVMIPAFATLDAQDQNQERNREQAQLQQHLMLQDGEMYIVKDQVRTKLKQQLKLHNGMNVNPDGRYMLKNGKVRQLENGQCLDMTGTRYRNQSQFMEKMDHQRMKMQNKNLNKEKMRGERNKGSRGRN